MENQKDKPEISTTLKHGDDVDIFDAPVASTDLPTIKTQPAPQLTAEVVQDMERAAQMIGRVLRAAVAMTRKEQWKPFGDVMYLEADGALTIARGLGLSIGKPEAVFKELPGGALQCVVKVTVWKGDRRYEDFGDCDSFDDFLVTRRRQLERNGATPEQTREILKVDMMKKAYANALSRAISGWAGIRGLSAESLAEFGLRWETNEQVQFRQGSAGGAIKTITCRQALTLPIGSKFAVRGIVLSGVQRAGRKPYCVIKIGDDTGEIEITYWKQKPDGLQSGRAVFFPEVEVRQFRGEVQFSANRIEIEEIPEDIFDVDANGKDVAGSGSLQSDTTER